MLERFNLTQDIFSRKGTKGNCHFFAPLRLCESFFLNLSGGVFWLSADAFRLVVKLRVDRLEAPSPPTVPAEQALAFFKPE